MSDVHANTDGRADSLNKAAAHDTGLYDPNRHDNQIVAVYESNARANTAHDALIGAGIRAGAIQVIEGAGGDAVSATSSAEDRNHGIWGAIRSLFVPEEEASAYSQAVGRGHAMVVVTPDATMDRHRLIQVLEESNPIDFDAKLEEWRQAGYDNLPQAGAVMTDTGDTEYRTGLVEERMRVGRRETAPGAVRVRSYVAERTAEQLVRLHEERIGGPGAGTGLPGQ